MLNLNGHCFYVCNSVTVLLTDSDPAATHNFRVESSGLWVLDDKGDKTVSGGIITGGGVQLGSFSSGISGTAVFDFYNGSMRGNTGGGGSANDVFVFSGEFINSQDTVIALAGAAPTTGDGTAAYPYELSTVEQLQWFALEGSNNNICAKLMNDIDLANEPWTPIANYTGTFDGNSIEIYLKATYLRTLRNGAHTITLAYNGGDVSTAFTVTLSDSDRRTSPTTFDAGVALYMVTVTASLAGLNILRRRQKHEA